MSVSFHLYNEKYKTNENGGYVPFFPGTGKVSDVGNGEGTNYSVNVPLKEGITDDAYETIFVPVMNCVMERFRPSAIVLQCGADSIKGDLLGHFNMTLKGHGKCVEFMRKQNLPLLMLGGGGYTPRNVARCWTYETALALGLQLPNKPLLGKPLISDFGQSFNLHINPHYRMINHNTTQDLDNIKASVLENLRSLQHAPSVPQQDRISLPSLISNDEEKENVPIEKTSVKIWDIPLAKTNELRDSDEEEWDSTMRRDRTTPSVESEHELLSSSVSSDEEEAEDDPKYRNSEKNLDNQFIELSVSEEEEREMRATSSVECIGFQISDQFLTKHRELINWVGETKQSILADELPKDADTTLALIKLHVERWRQCKEKTKEINNLVQGLIDKEHLIAEEKLASLNNGISEFWTLWSERKVLYGQCIDMKLLQIDIKKAKEWVANQQTFLENTDLGDSLDSVEELIKKHEDFEKSLTEQESKNSEIVNRAEKMIDWDHDFVGVLLQDIKLCLESYAAVREKVDARGATLQSTLKRMRLEKFEKDCEETSKWIQSKMKFANDIFDFEEIQKHANFMKDLHSHRSQLDEVLKSGRKLTDSDKSDGVEARAKEITHSWEELEKAAEMKESLLRVGIALPFNHAIRNVELWLSEVEARLKSDDCGKDCAQSLKLEYQLLESDLTLYQDRIDAIRNAAEEIAKTSYHDKENMAKRAEDVWERFAAYKSTFVTRKRKLDNRLLYDELSKAKEKVEKIKSRKRANDLSDQMDPQDLPTPMKVRNTGQEEKQSECFCSRLVQLLKNVRESTGEGESSGSCDQLGGGKVNEGS